MDNTYHHLHYAGDLFCLYVKTFHNLKILIFYALHMNGKTLSGLMEILSFFMPFNL